MTEYEAEIEGRAVRLSEREFFALDAIAWVLNEMQQDPDIYKALASSRSLDALISAYARLREKPLTEVLSLVHARFFEDRGLRARVDVLQEELDEARGRIRALEAQLRESMLHVA